MNLVTLLLLIHLLICLVVYILAKLDVLRSSQLSMSIVVLVPIWGLLCLLIQEIRVRIHADPFKEVGIEKLLVNDEIHRSILVDEDEGAENVVPLEEALLVNDVSTRRGLMMEVMYADPGDYVTQLQAARMNDDTEVVHYAVTALVELQKEYDLQFQRLERIMALDPDDTSALTETISLTERYLGSGLLEGNARIMQLRSYSDLLERRLAKVESAALWARKVDTDLKLGEYAKADEGIHRMLEQWPRDERGYLFLIRYHALVKDRAGIDQALALIRENNVYLSPSGRSEVIFWGGEADQPVRPAQEEAAVTV